MHRRAGKSVYCVAKLMEEASNAPGSAQFHYVGPSIKQTKAIAWRYAQDMARTIPGTKLNQADLKVTFPSKATLELLGVENIDSLRGRYSDGIVLDEAQLMPVSHWTYVIRPLLADRQGWAFVTGTPAGKHNLLGWAYEQPNFYTRLLRYDETGALPASEIEDMRHGMSAEAWSQEMECSFTAALQGAYYAELLRNMVAEGRYTDVRYDEALPVVAALDLGHRDLMPVVFAQEVGTETRIIGHKTYQFTSLPDMLTDWRSLPFPVDRVILPHDARVRELGSGKTRQEVFEGRGYQTVIAPNQSLLEGIEGVRLFLPHVWIDQSSCALLFEALSGYRSEYKEDRGVFSVTPLHSWESHHADAFRYLALGDRNVNTWAAGPRDTRGIKTYV